MLENVVKRSEFGYTREIQKLSIIISSIYNLWAQKTQVSNTFCSLWRQSGHLRKLFQWRGGRVVTRWPPRLHRGDPCSFAPRSRQCWALENWTPACWWRPCMSSWSSGTLTAGQLSSTKFVRHDQRGHHSKCSGETVWYDQKGHHERWKYSGKTDDTVRGGCHRKWKHSGQTDKTRSEGTPQKIQRWNWSDSFEGGCHRRWRYRGQTDKTWSEGAPWKTKIQW